MSLARQDWLLREEAHRDRADALTAAHRDRATRAEKHPVWDFLFTYYSYKPAVLRRWHPGAGVVLEDAAETSRGRWRGYVASDPPGSLVVDADALNRLAQAPQTRDHWILTPHPGDHRLGR